MHSIFTKIPPFDSTLNYVVIFRQLDRVAIVDGGIVWHVVLWWGCGVLVWVKHLTLYAEIFQKSE